MTFAGEFLGLPGLRGYWPMSAFDSSGNAIDQSGNGRTLTYNGNPTFNFTTQGGPYCDYDGTGDFHSRADEAGLDIIGTESYVASAVRGLTIGGWFWYDSLSAGGGSSLTKTDAATVANSAYVLQISGSNSYMRVFGASEDNVVSSVTLSTGAWYFIGGRFVPSTSVDVYVNGTKTTSTSSIVASLNNSTAPFNIGAQNNGTVGTLMNGRAGMCFVCAMALSDTAIDDIYQNTKASYGL